MNYDFIEVKRVTNDKNDNQIAVPETICVADILTFRPWHPGKNDTLPGEQTLIVLNPNSKIKGDTTKTNEIHIHEPYKEFLKRMSGRVIVLAK